MRYTDPDGRAVFADDIVIIALAVLVTISAVVVFNNKLQLSKEDFAAVAQYCSDVCTVVYNAISLPIQEYYAVKAKTIELTKNQTDRKSVGSYTITFESGKTYSGKGPIKRAIDSAIRESLMYNDMPSSIDWMPAISDREAYKSEYIRIQNNGGPQGLRINGKNYNIRQSPGRKFYIQDYGCPYREN